MYFNLPVAEDMTLPVVPINTSPYARGTYSKVARRLGVTPQAVRLVALGKVTSARIAVELRREARRFARRSQRIGNHAGDVNQPAR